MKRSGAACSTPIFVLGLFLLSCGNEGVSSRSPTAVFEPSACVMAIPVGQDPATVRCGYVNVPEDRQHPDGRELRLAVAVLPATGADATDDPIVNLGAGIGPVLDNSMQMFTIDFAAPL